MVALADAADARHAAVSMRAWWYAGLSPQPIVAERIKFCVHDLFAGCLSRASVRGASLTGRDDHHLPPPAPSH